MVLVLLLGALLLALAQQFLTDEGDFVALYISQQVLLLKDVIFLMLRLPLHQQQFERHVALALIPWLEYVLLSTFRMLSFQQQI
jgi:hypothetical protein